MLDRLRPRIVLVIALVRKRKAQVVREQGWQRAFGDHVPVVELLDDRAVVLGVAVEVAAEATNTVARERAVPTKPDQYVGPAVPDDRRAEGR